VQAGIVFTVGAMVDAGVASTVSLRSKLPPKRARLATLSSVVAAKLKGGSDKRAQCWATLVDTHSHTV
jgi:hypothetical protein